MIPGDLLSAFPHRQFHTLPDLLDSWAALPNSNPNACMPMQGGSLYHFYDGLWYDPAERRTHDLPCERRTRYRLSQPDTVSFICRVNARNMCRRFFFHQLAENIQNSPLFICTFCSFSKGVIRHIPILPHGSYAGYLSISYDKLFHRIYVM